MERRPNVVVVLTDQQTASAMSCAGNADVATPAMDSLATLGTRFARAYCTQPLCTPSRASMWTGRMPTELGVTVNKQAIPAQFADAHLGHLFTTAGYDTGYVGKWHLPGRLDETSAYTYRVGDMPDNELGAASAELIGRRRDKPFLLVTSFNEPHGICQWARSQPPPPGEIPSPAQQDWPPLPANYPRGSYEAELPLLARDRLPAIHPTDGWDEDTWRRYRYAYYRLVEHADAQVSQVVAALDTNGHRDNTLVVFTSDHGDGVGAHQWNQKWVLYEEAAAVPLIVSPPGSPDGGVDQRLVSVGLDLLPTQREHCCAGGAVWPVASSAGRRRCADRMA